MQLRKHEQITRKVLVEAGVDSPGLCARMLVAHVAGLDKVGYILAGNEDLAPEAAARLADLTLRRAQGEPMAYILGKKEFYGIEFIVSPAVLTPRPETELLVELALANLPEKNTIFADLGCGSGCIGLSLLKIRPEWTGIFMDLSSDALEIAKRNAVALACKAKFVLADLFKPLLAAESCDLIISNPPYIGAAEKNLVMPETLAYEPHFALFSQQNGLAHLEAVIRCAANSLKKQGWLLLEHGSSQADVVYDLLKSAGFVNIAMHKDLANLPRCAMAQK